ncbi:MAG TPA: HEAT repeat domain-containing protein [Polyangiaceae bacterium]
MRLRSTLGAVLAAVLLLGAPARGDDFDPHGRHHHPPPRPPPASHGPPARPGKPPSDAAAPEGPASAALIERYARIVLAQPGSAFPLQRLAQLYRDKDGDLKGLVADFEKRAAQAGPEQYAATVTLAGVYKLDGRPDDALATYEKAIALAPGNAAGLLALARAQQDRGNVAAARTRYEQALAVQKASADREQTIRTLEGLCLDAKDWDAAKQFHTLLVKNTPASLFVRGELARELYSRGEYERAEKEFQDLVTASQGDNRTLAPALKDLGKTLAKEHKNAEALSTLKRALTVAGAEAGVRGEVYEAMTEIYRADQRLPEWVAVLEAEHPSDFPRLALLGALYEETGDAPKALATYRRALASNPRQIDLRLKMIRLMQSQGDLDAAIAEYEGLIRAAPNNPQFVFEECEALLQRGDRARALKLLTELEMRGGSDEDVLSRVADFYQRIGEGERSIKVLTRLAQTNASDPSHLVDLGDRYFQDGNTPLALQTWKRLLIVVQPRARALSVLGDVYLEHDMTAEALAALREALQLDHDNPGVKKQLANALERARSYREAVGIWSELAAKAKQSNDKVLAREARSHIVTLWGLERIIDAQVGPLAAQFNTNPPDVDAGRTLAEVQLHLRRLADAEVTLRKVIDLARGDADAYLALERVLVQENKLEQAIATLDKLATMEPKRARELFQRMAQYALQIYKDEDAIRYAQRAVDLNPDDAEGHRRLGEMYRSRQDTEHAIVEFRAAIAKNDRLYVVYLELADLLFSRGESAEADRLYRRVVRGAPDEELVGRAARLSMQINLGNGTLESLEQELLPLAIGNPQRPIFRRLLVEVYGNLTFGLVQAVKRSEGPGHASAEGDAARAALARVGGRAVKPLLDALADTDASQQRIAIDVLGYVQNKNAGPALFAFATSNADTALRVRAMVACGSLRDPSMLPKYRALLEKGDDVPSDNVAVAAAWGIARMEDKRAIPLLRSIAKQGMPEMRALAVLGLGALRDRASAGPIADLARGGNAGSSARAAAAYVLGEIGSEQDRATLLALAEGREPLSRQMAILALSRMPAPADKAEERATITALADALFEAGDAESPRAQASAAAIRKAGAAALMTLATRVQAGPPGDPLAALDDAVEVETILKRLVPTGFSVEDRSATLVQFAEPIERAAKAALQTSSDRYSAVVDALMEGDGAFEPFVGPVEGTAAAHETARGIARSLEPNLVTFTQNSDPAVRARVLVLLARSANADATEALIQALSDPSDVVERTALAAIGTQPDHRAVIAVSRVLSGHESWAMRVLAAQALGRLGAAGARADAGGALRKAAEHDPYALVREAALRAWASFDRETARPLARTLAATDAEPRVREAALQIASGP